jgi:hypothetical protein
MSYLPWVEIYFAAGLVLAIAGAVLSAVEDK